MATFHNPILRGFNPDPTVCVVPGASLAFPRPGSSSSSSTSTTHYFLSTSTFEYFPGCAIYHSTDLLNWDLVGHALTRRSQLEMRTVEPGAGSWASTLRYREDEKRWYLATGVYQRYRPSSDERIFPRGFYVWTDNIWDSSSWSDPVYFDNPGFDQDLFWDDATSKVYLSTTTRLKNRPAGSKQKDFAIHVSEIDLPTGRTLTPPVVIRQSHHGIAEGSHILRRGPYYYLLTAEGGTEAGHQEWIFRSRDGVLGPWEGQGKPLWYNGPDEEVQRTGHVDIFADGNGDWWGVFLGVRPVRRTAEDGGGFLEPQMGRETFLVKVDWVDDWPVFNEGMNITLETKGRGGHVKQSLAELKPGDVKWRADLSSGELDLGWYQKNTPLKQCYSLTEKPGFLRIYGNCYDLTWPEAPAMLLRKQTSYHETFHATMYFDPTQTGYEAGMVLWWSQFSFATIGVTLHGGSEGQGAPVRTLVCRRPKVGGGVQESYGPTLKAGGSEAVRLMITARATEYALEISSNEATEKVVIGASELTTMPPVGGAFCGVMVGLYSFGKGEPVLDPADFSDMSIVEEGPR
ncbi:hypothetical protein JX265_001545 [Neoarthrinium moseri]|uniref:Beta-xylosidase C-terminal Concanavalin A-like domain-containing protein n=1 Tax=Neoarthrinium moseri TaxID=1658444 RepID=A0A9P9WV95_9PEZI|nr:hypothetical protein JX265_001545 [Neoarthrinium moseri]